MEVISENAYIVEAFLHFSPSLLVPPIIEVIQPTRF